MILQKYWEQTRQAHNWVSMDLERSANRVISEYSAELENDLLEIEAAAVNYQKDPTEALERYQALYEKYFLAWIAAKSRCMSSFVTGPANFPVEKANRANERERAACLRLSEVTNKAKKAIIKSFQPAVTLDSELENLKIRLSAAIDWQESMKQANKIIRAANGTDCTADLMALYGMNAELAADIQKPNYCGNRGFQSFSLSNNLAETKRLAQRVKDLETKVKNRNQGLKKELICSGFKVIENAELDRIMFYFEGKPAAEVITLMKKNAFKWSPKNGAWQRKITGNAQWATKRLVEHLNNLN